ncbi:TPA: hypothetical protein L3577_004740 [Pseudomonas aeruginosa]|uniref:Uncharacterized protein n=1 Tax=Pseudomonas aeruginosa TaxID=287 RepID=A0A7S6C764_PSEAI|nr:hypothetical protein [Pseudomonas aeruginosa]ELF7124911.1 hypothetical protein [Pseudomonas aeruginosa]QLG05228.1 hypothetical protein [Pseudomonas aeruginosa]RQA53516.1 hypothetical protein IPC483_30795 [Pseudomonas aeruginosa]HBN7587558.1 hypothetical protein [Pseudomonas aeruginosa]HBN8086906.1 hypothetical protein [Pseudomonas aeruginosa]
MKICKKLHLALDNAAHAVAVAPEVHSHYKDPPPTSCDNIRSWILAFIDGLIGDLPLHILRCKFSALKQKAAAHLRALLHQFNQK